MALHEPGCLVNYGAVNQMASSNGFKVLDYVETFLIRQFRFEVMVEVLFIRLAHSIVLLFQRIDYFTIPEDY